MTTPVPPAAPAPAAGNTNTLAIIALIAGIVVAPVGIVLGFIALGQIKKTGEAGKGFATWGIIIGFVLTILWILTIVLGAILPLLIYGGVAGTLPGY